MFTVLFDINQSTYTLEFPIGVCVTINQHEGLDITIGDWNIRIYQKDGLWYFDEDFPGCDDGHTVTFSSELVDIFICVNQHIKNSCYSHQY